MDEQYQLLADNSQVALEWSAVLESQEIPYESERRDDGRVVFFLEEEHFLPALENIRAYERERPFFQRVRELFAESREPLRLKDAFPAGLVSILLVIFYLAAPPDSKWSEQGMLSAKFFTESHWWVPFTALGLHASPTHLLGNIAFFMVFGTAASIRFGGAVAVFLTILAGTAANLTTLFLFGDRVYNALGFSGAVFATLGMLAASRVMEKSAVEKISSFYFWIPLIAAAAILGSMGSSPGSDLAGHLFGFLWGCLAAFPARFLAKRKNRGRMDSLSS